MTEGDAAGPYSSDERAILTISMSTSFKSHSEHQSRCPLLAIDPYFAAPCSYFAFALIPVEASLVAPKSLSAFPHPYPLVFQF